MLFTKIKSLNKNAGVRFFVGLFLISLILSLALWGLLQNKKGVSIGLSLNPVGNMTGITLTVMSESNLKDVNGRIILPEGFEFVEGDLNWETDLVKGEPEEFDVVVKPILEGVWDIEAFAKGYSSVELKINIDSSLKAELITRIDPSQITNIEMTWKERIERDEERMKDLEWIERYYRICNGTECAVPEPLKGGELNDYFKSLDLKEDPVYVLVQFDTLGAEPSLLQLKRLELAGMSFFEGYPGSGYSYYSKASRNFLENKNYDFIRWIGIRGSGSKLYLFDGRLDGNCTGRLKILIGFYEGLEDSQIEKLSEFFNIEIDPEVEYLHVETDVDKIKEVASWGFIRNISPLVIERLAVVGFPQLRDLEYDYYGGVICN
ncbi:MAG: hypothetical protein IH845_04705 [Nanoarchaeota archaeon]|nr:hypothetical protein [Nanoarchaeota archaeon]